MFWGRADQITTYALRVAFNAFLCVGCINSCFAQAEPPLFVLRAGLLPGPSLGCDVGLGTNTNLYGSLGPIAAGNPGGNVGAAPNANANFNSTLAGNLNSGDNVPLYSTDLTGNVPLYSTPDLGGNFPLYSTPTPGSNAPLYSNSNLGNYSTLGNYSGAASSAVPAVNTAPLRCRSAIPVGEWLLYPSLRLYSLYSDNLFLTPTAPIKALGFGMSPSLTAEWTNGIHTTTIYADTDNQIYPTDNSINQFNREVSFTQKYSPLPDLTFTGLGDYSHQTISSSLVNSIQTPTTTLPTTPTLLPNGNTQLPNGNVVSPSGQILGNINQALAISGVALVNPSDTYTASATATKIFNGATLTLGSSLINTTYQQPFGTGPASFTSTTSKTLTEHGSVSLGPLFYAYSNGSFSMVTTNASEYPNSDVYQVVGGIGTRQFGLFRASAYFGHQGSESGFGTAGGDVYGGKLSYYPTLAWTFSASIDETINVTSTPCSSPSSSPLALTLPTNTPVQIALSSCTRITTPSLQTTYQISQQWTFLGNFSYSGIEYIGSPALANTWLADLRLSYEIWRNMTLTGEYQFTDVMSNVAGESARRNLIMLSANYRF